MKKILLGILISVLLIGCQKNEVELAPSISWKVGIIYDANIQKRNLALEFQSSFGSLDQVCFESTWAFEVDGSVLYLELQESDFVWSSEGRTLKGLCKTSLGELLSDPKVLHKGTVLNGTAKIDGKWYYIYDPLLP